MTTDEPRGPGDEHSCVLEYNVVAWGSARLLPQAGAAVYDHGDHGKIAAVRVYDDVEPPGPTSPG